MKPLLDRGVHATTDVASAAADASLVILAVQVRRRYTRVLTWPMALNQKAPVPVLQRRV